MEVLRATVASVGAVVVADRKVPSVTVLYLGDVLEVFGTGACFGAVLDVVLVAVGGGLDALGVVSGCLAPRLDCWL